VIPPTSTAHLLPITIESPGQSIAFKYVGNTSSLLSVDHGAGKKVIITYKDNQMNGLFTYEADKVYYVDYYRDDQKRIHKVTQWSQTKDEDIPMGYYTIKYNEQQQITEINYYSARNVLLRTKTFAYDLSNDQMGVIIESDDKETTKYTFDLKNGIFKNVANAQLIALETGDKFLLSSNHNLIGISSSSPKNDLTCSYEYNTDAYPTLINWQAVNVKMTFKVSYKQM
jgi:hypothetical protein